jgi:hypothetical protein
MNEEEKKRRLGEIKKEINFLLPNDWQKALQGTQTHV